MRPARLQRLSPIHTLLHCGGALLLGLALYALTRDPPPFLLQNFLPITWKSVGLHQIPAQWPSFLHSYALVVATRYLFPLSTPRHQLVALLSIGLAFALELVQHSVIALALPTSSAPILGKLFESIKHYALFGTFDVYDLVAVMFGGLIALWITRLRPIS